MPEKYKGLDKQTKNQKYDSLIPGLNNWNTIGNLKD